MRSNLPSIILVAALVVAGSATPAAAVAAEGPRLSVDLTAGRHPISPYVYGTNFTDEALADELGLPVRRWGGNATTRYHFRHDTTNRASDWFFENIEEENANPAALPDGSSTDEFVEQDRRTGTASILTLPLIGWAPKARDGSCGFSVAKYGPQQRTDEWRPDCGNGVRPDGTPITGNDPHDTSVEVGAAYITDWLGHLTGKYGTAAQGGVKFYNLDNEPDIWHSTHRDVHPVGASSAELRDRAYLIGAAVKAADPGAKTLGPVGWGWTSWDYSGLDQETCARTGCWGDPPDRPARGGLPFTTWYLQQMKNYQDQHGVRVLDYFDMHFYPQAGGVAFGGGGDPAVNALRLRSTRALWDPAYTDESWIGAQVRLIPRMKELVAANYPGTGTAITEYNWGALDHVNGALTQADIFGIFGREGLDLATLWSPPSSAQPGAYAFRMYLNYDGAGGRFGDVSVRSASADQDRLSVYGAERAADGALTMMVVNKSGTDLTSAVDVTGRFAPTAQVYRYGAGALTAITHAPDQALTKTATGSTLTHTFPADSITLFVVPRQKAEARYRNLDNSTRDKTIKPAFQASNPGPQPIALNRVTMRYWFTRDGGSPITLACGQAQLGCSKITRKVVPLTTPRPGADAYLEVGFTANAGTLGPGQSSGRIELCLTKNNGTFTETGDHSWAAPAAGYANNPKVTVYVDGVRVAGTEP
ncbi:hypothetical protein Acor_47080 [Acrocarpospora corrugata]|uniref:CBM3 domain-containing protein n=1 Tax=Acrocarpospora corrugata TaxID=35763 RepID=A0A5M3W3P6_9ACTN|nr:glycoside hydrolase family 44 protein [Acrocarpospora corrugata]GES02642.1 hypothetical protein Acor_47080 [Acrocarpospora corrugata]